MEPTECAKVEPPAPAAAASASVSLPSSQQSSVTAATDASAASTAQRNHPNVSNGNSAFAMAAASQASNAKAVAAAAAKEDRPSASAAVEHKIGGGGELDSEVNECKKTVGSEGASEAARSDSAGNNNFPKKASAEEEKNKAVEMDPMDPANKGKINAERIFIMILPTIHPGGKSVIECMTLTQLITTIVCFWASPSPSE